MNNINETIGATSQKAMVNPHIGGGKYADGISIRAFTIPNMLRTAPNHATITRLTIMNANSMYDYMANTLYRNASPVCNLHFSSSPINAFVAIHHELILQRDDHVLGESYPKGFCLDCTITKCARFWVYRVIRRISDFIYITKLSSYGIFAKANCTIRQGLAIRSPICFGSPT
ncbi:hypothetical protein V8G54_032588 [Vigna mungo]|uniref:Uncharacterized protein n=1 Tax=Vigna mungo TaxID=3915 RepID=A0AAQ3MKG9_VIGMU